jgi:hypothetical protein
MEILRGIHGRITKWLWSDSVGDWWFRRKNRGKKLILLYESILRRWLSLKFAWKWDEVLVKKEIVAWGSHGEVAFWRVTSSWLSTKTPELSGWNWISKSVSDVYVAEKSRDCREIRQQSNECATKLIFTLNMSKRWLEIQDDKVSDREMKAWKGINEFVQKLLQMWSWEFDAVNVKRSTRNSPLVSRWF